MTQHRLLLLTSILTASLVACGEDAPSSPSDAEYDDVAQSVAGLAFEEAGDDEMAGDVARLAAGDILDRFLTDASGAWTGERRQLSYTYDIECRTGRGVTIDPCDLRTRTASIAVRVEGELDTPRRQGRLLRIGAWDLAWDGSDTATIDGVTSTDVSSTFEALHRRDERSYVMAADALLVGLELDLPARQIVAGRIEYALEMARTRSTRFRDVEATFSVEAVVEFTPGGPAVITLDRVRTYRVDPATRRIEPVE